MSDIIESLIPKKAFQERYEISDAWMEVIGPIITSSETFREKFNYLLDLNNIVGIYNFDKIFEIFKLIEPEDVKVVLLIDEVIGKNSSPYPLIDLDYDINQNVQDEIYFTFNELEELLSKKFKGSTYPMLKKRVFNGQVTGEQSINQFRRMQRYFNESEIVSDSPFLTYNWYKQGVLVINPEMVGHPKGVDMSTYFRTLMLRMLGYLQAADNPIIVASWSQRYSMQYASYVRSYSKGLFERDLDRFFVKLNNAVLDLFGQHLIIDFLC